MKKIFFLLLCYLISGCTFHSGLMTPANVIVQGDNFKRIGTIYGSATATYILGIGGNEKLGLVNEAKNDLYTKHNLGANQTIANITYDISKTMVLGPLYYMQTCHISADIYEFSKDGNYTLIANNDNSYKLGKLQRYFAGQKVMFKINEEIYKATVFENTGADYFTATRIYQLIDEKWESKAEMDKKRIPFSLITHYMDNVKRLPWD